MQTRIHDKFFNNFEKYLFTLRFDFFIERFYFNIIQDKKEIHVSKLVKNL